MGEYASGKDYLCNRLVETYGATRLSFSDEVRRLAAQIFDWLPFDFSPEIKDKPFKHPKNTYNLTPRQIWLLVGKVREVTPSYFVDAFLQNQMPLDVFSKDKLYIITDFRTSDEWNMIKQLAIPVIKIERESREGLIPNAFEEFVRMFNEYDVRFINNMNGTEEFDKFIKEFLNARTAD